MKPRTVWLLESLAWIVAALVGIAYAAKIVWLAWVTL
jgi:hypothetical protein